MAMGTRVAPRRMESDARSLLALPRGFLQFRIYRVPLRSIVDLSEVDSGDAEVVDSAATRKSRTIWSGPVALKMMMIHVRSGGILFGTAMRCLLSEQRRCMDIL